MTLEEALSGFISNNVANPVSFGGGFGANNQGVGNAFGGIDLSAMQAVRHRSSGLERYLPYAKDAFDYVTGIDPNAYEGKTAKQMLENEQFVLRTQPPKVINQNEP